MEDVLAITDPGSMILDPFMGSGSTGVAARKTGRQFIGVEYTEHYFQIAAERLGISTKDAA